MRRLLSYCALLFLGSFLAGLIPISFSIKKSRLSSISVFGAGLLLGSATLIVIPEGVNSVYQQYLESSHHHQSEHSRNASSLDPAVPSEHHEHSSAAETIGLSLTIGFCLMLVLDQLSNHIFEGATRKDNNPVISASDDTIQMNRRANTLLLGLFIHGLTDGIALGSSLSNPSVSSIIFLAIIIHKGPSAFGLVSMLMHFGLKKQAVRIRLLIFSLAGPLGTLITFFLTLNMANSMSFGLNSGSLMVFSGGSFLYVATMHVLPSVSTGHSHNHLEGEGDLFINSSSGSPFRESSNSTAESHTLFTKFLLLLGVFSPLLLMKAINHS